MSDLPEPETQAAAPADPPRKRKGGKGWRSKSPAEAPVRSGGVVPRQPSLFESAPIQPRALAVLLSPDERMHRDRVLSTPGGLRRAMALLEQCPMPDGWCAEVWRWVTSMAIVQGLQADTTVTRYVDTMRRFAQWLLPQAELDYRTIGAPVFDEWGKALFVQRRNKPAWRAVQLQALKSFYDWRHRAGLGLNCAAQIRMPRRTKRTPRKYSRADLQKIFQAVKDTASAMVAQRDRVMLLFFLTTGARESECAELRLDQVELEHKTGRIRFLGKGAKERTVGITGPIVDELRTWILLRDQVPVPVGETVFWSTHPSHFGNPLSASGIEGMVRRYATRAGLGEWGVHRFRVTYATGLYDDGTGIEEIRIALGHENIETTRQYLAISERQTATRLNPARQYDALGEPPRGLPLWAQRKLKKAKGGGDAQPV